MNISRQLILCLRLLIAVGATFSSCRDFNRNKSHPEIYDRSIIKGRKLAAVHCQSCHILPSPELLDTRTWETGVLPHMGPRLGIYEYHFQRYPLVNNRNLPAGFHPSRAQLTEEEWKNILDYYIATSPDTMPIPGSQPALSSRTDLFSIEIPALHYDNPAVSFLKINPSGSQGMSIVATDFSRQTIFRFDKNLQVIDSLFSAGGIVDIDFKQDTMLVCNMGIFDPSDEKYGDARYITSSAGGLKKDSILFGKLGRPVQLSPADLNGDGRTDYVVCEFGYNIGALSWQENKGSGNFEHHVIKEVPGATRVVINDYNKDGRLDIWALFAQGDEGISLFTNKGDGKFEEKRVLRFPPVYGSSYFELADFNKDGHPDIVYSAGDNADFSMVLKPYHGMYVFINDGSNNFKQQYFYPVNGCYKVLARDFDNDGDLDLASIAFFADFAHHPEEGFNYFENRGDLKFIPSTIGGTTSGRWITIDAGDIDGDGKIDLVLGNFASAPSFIKGESDWKKGTPFIVLRNIGRP